MNSILMQPLLRQTARTVFKATLDTFAWVLSFVILWSFDNYQMLVVAVVAHLAIGTFAGLYSAKSETKFWDKVPTILVTVLIAGFISVIFMTLFSDSLLKIEFTSQNLVSWFSVSFLAALAWRYLWTEIVNRFHTKNIKTLNAKPALIFGAGYLGDLVVKKILHDKNSEYYPVGFIDDDGLKKNRELDGFPVLGNRSDLIQVAKATNAEALVISVLNLDREVMADLTKMASQANLKLYISPTLKEVTEEGAALNDFRDIDISDFIGRSPLNLDTSTISSYITGARVLVTGAGGSIGSVLAKQVYKFGPSELMLLDRDESALQSTELDVFGNGLLNTKEVILADIRDQESLQKIFDERKPQVVFHTAALKHLPMLEQFPTESWKTNVLGTLNVLEAAMKAGVETFVNISTDKAANPTSFLGLSKRYGERLTSWFADKSGKRYISVRFGNVLGSRGSLIPTLFSLIEQNKPLTITHPDATRYFMTIPEACQLVIQAGGIARPGELLILDMGEPVRIQDIAEKMLQFSRKKLDIVYTGLRQGEKLHEELSGEGENLEKPFHPKISHTIIPNLSPKTLNLEVFLSRSEESNND